MEIKLKEGLLPKVMASKVDIEWQKRLSGVTSGTSKKEYPTNSEKKAASAKDCGD